jgi:hypothetical protein
MRLKRMMGCLALLALALAACNMPGTAGQETPTNTPAPDIAPSPTPPPAASPTPVPVDTAPPAEPTATPPPTATSGPDFAQASVYAVAHLSGDRLLVTIQVPGGVAGNYTAGVSTSTLRCEMLSDYPDRLYCSGPEPYTNYTYKDATVSLYPAGSASPVFTADFQIPPLATPTPTPTKTPTPTSTP